MDVPISQTVCCNQSFLLLESVQGTNVLPSCNGSIRNFNAIEAFEVVAHHLKTVASIDKTKYLFAIRSFEGGAKVVQRGGASQLPQHGQVGGQPIKSYGLHLETNFLKTVDSVKHQFFLNACRHTVCKEVGNRLFPMASDSDCHEHQGLCCCFRAVPCHRYILAEINMANEISLCLVELKMLLDRHAIQQKSAVSVLPTVFAFGTLLEMGKSLFTEAGPSVNALEPPARRKLKVW